MLAGSAPAGVDYLVGGSSQKSQNQTVYAAASGIVVFSTRSNENPKPARGGLVVIRHVAPDFPNTSGERYPNPAFQQQFVADKSPFQIAYLAFDTQDIATYYLHLDPSQIFVSKGDEVVIGQAIGKLYSRSDKFAYPPHLHFEVWKKCQVTEFNGYETAGSAFQSAVDSTLMDPVGFLEAP